MFRHSARADARPRPHLAFLACLAGAFVALAAGAPRTVDPLAAALRAAGVDPAALGFTPRGSWARYPDPRQIPYVTRPFEDLFAHPDRIPGSLRLIAQAQRDFLAPEYGAAKSDGLLRAAFYAGWNLRRAGHRDYASGLNDALPEGASDPLAVAIARLYADAGLPFDLYSMDKPADWPLRRRDVNDRAARLDPALQRIVAQAVLDLAGALRWHRAAFRAVDGKALLTAATRRDMTATQFDGMEYYPELDDIARTLDEDALITSSRMTVDAAARLEAALVAWAKGTDADPRTQAFDVVTPAGRIVVAGAGDDAHDERDVLLLVDLGGRDRYTGTAGAGSITQPVSVLVDLRGDDAYAASDPRAAVQGAGVLGTGVLIDAAGGDRYASVGSSQGYGLFGTGLLVDRAGDDVYELDNEGQGAAEFGVGLLFDLAGDDRYGIVSAGQGFGGVGGGIGALVDFAGNDHYFAEPDASKAFRPDYHSQAKVNYSYAQGAAAGRRGDLVDGHSWAGGIGTLVDLAGNDEFVSGNWGAGSGYWYGIGWLYDGAGDDLYRSSVFSLASGAHFCIGAILDEAGDDRYEGLGDAHTGLAFGHDFTIALLYDGAGNDAYRYGADGFGYAINMSLAFLVDAGGDDTYAIDKGKEGFGVTNVTPADLAPGVARNYVADPIQVGLFLDVAGRDRYLERDAATGTEHPSPARRDGSRVLRPANPGEANGARHAGIFVDRSDAKPAAIEWFRNRWSATPPPKP
jgi:hypothetical protein